MKTWYDFYKDRMGPGYLQYVADRYKLFLDILKEFGNGTYYEAGCGIGTITKLLALEDEFSMFYLSDACPKMLGLAHENLSDVKGTFLLQREMLPWDSDAFPPTYEAIVHGHGVLEHFTDHQITETVRKQRVNAPRAVVHYVPSNKYTIPSFGDERLMSKDEWHRICKPDEIVEFNDGFDYILIWNK